jgi:hypothetical protein
MGADRGALRWAVVKWLTPWHGCSLRVYRVSGRERHERCVRIEVERPQDLLSIFFFLHEDGEWRVFPPVGNANTSAGRFQYRGS